MLPGPDELVLAGLFVHAPLFAADAWTKGPAFLRFGWGCRARWVGDWAKKPLIGRVAGISLRKTRCKRWCGGKCCSTSEEAPSAFWLSSGFARHGVAVCDNGVYNGQSRSLR